MIDRLNFTIAAVFIFGIGGGFVAISYIGIFGLLFILPIGLFSVLCYSDRFISIMCPYKRQVPLGDEYLLDNP